MRNCWRISATKRVCSDEALPSALTPQESQRCRQTHHILKPGGKAMKACLVELVGSSLLSLQSTLEISWVKTTWQHHLSRSPWSSSELHKLAQLQSRFPAPKMTVSPPGKDFQLHAKDLNHRNLTLAMMTPSWHLHDTLWSHPYKWDLRYSKMVFDHVWPLWSHRLPNPADCHRSKLKQSCVWIRSSQCDRLQVMRRLFVPDHTS